MPSIEKTIIFIAMAHANQKRETGEDYVHHPIEVMNSLPRGVSEDVKIAALLHDVLEDTKYTRTDLEQMGYNRNILDMVKLVSKDPLVEKPYPERIKAIIDSGNVGAIVIKYTDVRVNSNPARLALLSEFLQTKFREKYRLPLIMLEKEVQKLGYTTNAQPGMQWAM